MDENFRLLTLGGLYGGTNRLLLSSVSGRNSLVSLTSNGPMAVLRNNVLVLSHD